MNSLILRNPSNVSLSHIVPRKNLKNFKFVRERQNFQMAGGVVTNAPCTTPVNTHCIPISCVGTRPYRTHNLSHSLAPRWSRNLSHPFVYSMRSVKHSSFICRCQNSIPTFRYRVRVKSLESESFPTLTLSPVNSQSEITVQPKRLVLSSKTRPLPCVYLDPFSCNFISGFTRLLPLLFPRV